MAGFGGATHLIAVRAQALTDTEVAVALMKLDKLGVRIVNMSFGEDAPEGPMLRDAIHKAAADGMLLVAAAGNSSAAVAYPAADLQPPGGGPSYGLAVGATDVTGGLADFSNSGERLSLVAPGGYQGPCSGVLVTVAPLTAFDGSCYPYWTGDAGAIYAYVPGTSFSAPEVAGVAALIWAKRPELKNYQVAAIIKQSARRDGVGWTPTMGCGVLDAGAALELATTYPGAGGTDGSCSIAGDPSPLANEPATKPTVLRASGVGEVGRPAHAQVQGGRADASGCGGDRSAEEPLDASSVSPAASLAVEPGQAYGLAWRAPQAPTKGAYRFCVTLTGLFGSRECAQLRTDQSEVALLRAREGPPSWRLFALLEPREYP